MPLYNKIIKDINEEDEEKELGTKDPINLQGGVQWAGDQYQKLPENFRTGLEEGTAANIEAIRQWNVQKRKENYWGGIGPLDPLITAGKAYSAVINPVKDQLSRSTDLDPLYFDALELGIDIATLNPKGTKSLLNKANLLDNIFPTNPLKVSEFVSSGAAAGIVGGNTNIWKRFGYGLDQPTQVKRAFANKRLSLAQKNEVSDSLFDYYSKVEKYRRSGKTVSSYPLYWVNPVTNDIYKATRKGKSYSLDSKNRYFRELQQSSITQKKGIVFKKDQIKEANIKLENKYLFERNKLLADINKYHSLINQSGSGKPGSVKMMLAQSKMIAYEKILKELGTKLDNLAMGRKGVQVYGEHGYNLANERMWEVAKYYGKRYSLGDASNFHPVLLQGNTKTFRQIKDKFESVINSKNAKGEYNYPELIVNYNPNLQKGNQEYIIRIESKNSIRLGDKNSRFPNVLHGDSVLEYNFLANPDQLKSVEDIKNFLSENGFVPRPGPGSIEDLRKYLRTDTKPLEGVSETHRRIMEDIIPDD